MSYKPRTISIGVKGSEPTGAEIRGRPLAVCDTSDVAVTEPYLAVQCSDGLCPLPEPFQSVFRSIFNPARVDRDAE